MVSIIFRFAAHGALVIVDEYVVFQLIVVLGRENECAAGRFALFTRAAATALVAFGECFAACSANVVVASIVIGFGAAVG